MSSPKVGFVSLGCPKALQNKLNLPSAHEEKA